MSTRISKTKTKTKQTNRYSSLKYNNGKQELECKAMNNSFNTILYSNKSMKWITFGKNHKYIQFKTVIQFKSNVYFFYILFYFILSSL